MPKSARSSQNRQVFQTFLKIGDAFQPVFGDRGGAIAGDFKEFAAGNQPHICGFAFPLPPFTEQTEILERLTPVLSELDHLDAEVDIQLAKANALRQPILKKAFSGQLVAQDPADKPASVLLARPHTAPAPAPTKRKKTA